MEERDFGGAGGTDGKAGRAVDTGQIIRTKALRRQPFQPAGVILPAAQRGDIIGRRAQRPSQRHIIDLGIMGERHHGGGRVEHAFQRLVGPAAIKRQPGKTRIGSK